MWDDIYEYYRSVSDQSDYKSFCEFFENLVLYFSLPFSQKKIYSSKTVIPHF